MTFLRIFRSRLALRGLVVLSVVFTVGCDRVTKRLAIEALAGSASRSFLADTVRLVYAENTGGFLSLGAGLPSHGRTAIFVVVSGLMLAAMGIGLLRHRWEGPVLLGGALFLAGGASNWIDRVLHGRVVDFLNVGVGSLRTGIFNVADIAIMVGLCLFLIGRAGARDAG
jgi:signal peptidase II